MEKEKYSEADIQDFAAGTFLGDTFAFEEFLNKNDPARELVSFYRALYQGLQQETLPLISIELATKLASIVKADQIRGHQQEVLWKNISLGGLWIVFMTAVIFTALQLSLTALSKLMTDPYFWTGLAGFIVFICLFHFAEIHVRKTMIGKYSRESIPSSL